MNSCRIEYGPGRGRFKRQSSLVPQHKAMCTGRIRIRREIYEILVYDAPIISLCYNASASSGVVGLLGTGRFEWFLSILP
jgi:hypothetical protein